MIRYRDGDIFRSGAEALVNPVNCVGVMGAGLAKQFRERFPENYRVYRDVCRAGDLEPGSVLAVYDCTNARRQWIINLPTKRDWRDPSRLDWIASGLDALAAEVRRTEVWSVAVPMIGCGLGGLGWRDVRPMIGAAFAGLPDVDVMVYGPKE